MRAVTCRRIVEQPETSDWSQTAAAEALRIPLSTGINGQSYVQCRRE